MRIARHKNILNPIIVKQRNKKKKIEEVEKEPAQPASLPMDVDFICADWFFDAVSLYNLLAILQYIIYLLMCFKTSDLLLCRFSSRCT